MKITNLTCKQQQIKHQQQLQRSNSFQQQHQQHQQQQQPQQQLPPPLPTTLSDLHQVVIYNFKLVT